METLNSPCPIRKELTQSETAIGDLGTRKTEREVNPLHVPVPGYIEMARGASGLGPSFAELLDMVSQVCRGFVFTSLAPPSNSFGVHPIRAPSYSGSSSSPI